MTVNVDESFSQTKVIVWQNNSGTEPMRGEGTSQPEDRHQHLEVGENEFRDGPEFSRPPLKWGINE